MKVGITGSRGLIGRALASELARRGDEAVPLARAPDLAALDGLDAVVHLAGEPIAKRWTRAQKQAIRVSRIEGTRELATLLGTLRAGPRVLVCASAIGYYGDRAEDLLDETSARGDGFLAEVVDAWEAAAQPARDAGLRVAHMRFGIVLSGEGGALPPLVKPMKMGAGGRIGSGRQWWSWVDLEDVAAALAEAVRDERYHGAINVVAPEPARNADFAQALGRALHRPAIMPLPAFAARMMLGEMADELLLFSQRVSPKRLKEIGFRFAYPDLETSLRHALGKSVDGAPKAAGNRSRSKTPRV